MSRTSGSIVMRPRNFGAPKKGWKFGRWQSADIKQAAELAKFQIRPTPGPIVTGLRTFGPKNGAMPKTHYATPISRILLGAVGDPTNLMWERVEIWGPKFQRAQKRELGPKKNQWVEGNISRLKFPQKHFQPRPLAGLAKHRFDRIQTQTLIN